MDKIRKLLLPVLAAIFLVGNFSPFLLSASAWDVPTWDMPKWDIPKWDAPAWDLDKEQDRQQDVPDDWKEEHEEEFSEDGEKQDYTDMNLWEFLASGEYKEYIKRLKNGLAQLPAEVYDYFESGDAGKEIQQWWKETNDYISNGGLLKDFRSAAKSLVSWESLKAFGAGLLTKEFYTGFSNDMTVGMLADIEAFATGIDPNTGKKINLQNRIDSLVQSFAKPSKIVKKVKAFDKIIDKLSIKKLDGKNSGKGQDSSTANGEKVLKAGGNHGNGSKGESSSERKKEAPLLDAPAAGDNVGNQLRSGKDSGDGKNGKGSSNGSDSKGGKDSSKDSSGGKKDGGKGTGFSGKLPSQGTVDAGIKGAPKVDAGKQGKHVPGHGNSVSTKSQWPKGKNGVQLTQDAWMKGTPVRADGSVKTYDFGKPVGPNGETRVKVHIDKKGNIHGYPVK